jgi:hypothetical protein
MADNITVRDYLGNQVVLAFRNIASVFYPLGKSGFGTGDTFTEVDDVLGQRLPVRPEGGPSGQSLNNASAAGTGTPVDLRGARATISSQIIFPNTVTAAQVALDLSNDGGTTWKQMALFDTAAGGASGDFLTSLGVVGLMARSRLVTITTTGGGVTSYIAAA